MFALAGRDQFRFAVDADEPFAQYRLIDDSEDSDAVLLQRDQRTPFVTAGDESSCAVHRIQNPSQSVRRRLFLKFFAENSVIRPLALDDGANRLLRTLVRCSDRIELAAFRNAL